jgi:hypothetical protein
MSDAEEDLEIIIAERDKLFARITEQDAHIIMMRESRDAADRLYNACSRERDTLRVRAVELEWERDALRTRLADVSNEHYQSARFKHAIEEKRRIDDMYQELKQDFDTCTGNMQKRIDDALQERDALKVRCEKLESAIYHEGRTSEEWYKVALAIEANRDALKVQLDEVTASRDYLENDGDDNHRKVIVERDALTVSVDYCKALLTNAGCDAGESLESNVRDIVASEAKLQSQLDAMTSALESAHKHEREAWGLPDKLNARIVTLTARLDAMTSDDAVERACAAYNAKQHEQNSEMGPQAWASEASQWRARERWRAALRAAGEVK